VAASVWHPAPAAQQQCLGESRKDTPRFYSPGWLCYSHTAPVMSSEARGTVPPSAGRGSGGWRAEGGVETSLCEAHSSALTSLSERVGKGAGVEARHVSAWKSSVGTAQRAPGRACGRPSRLRTWPSDLGERVAVRLGHACGRPFPTPWRVTMDTAAPENDLERHPEEFGKNTTLYMKVLNRTLPDSKR
jgi:hypothetical protein